MEVFCNTDVEATRKVKATTSQPSTHVARVRVDGYGDVPRFTGYGAEDEAAAKGATGARARA